MAKRAGFALVGALFVVTGCGGRDATVACEGSTCTVTYPAKARNNQASSGYGPVEVLGETTQLFRIAGGEATLRISDREVHLTAGKTQRVGPFTVQGVEITDTSAVLTYTKRAQP